MHGVHAGLDGCLGDASRPPLARVRLFFEMTQEHYRSEGYMGCLLGGLGQELSGVSDVFRRKIEECFSVIAEQLTVCLEEAQGAGRDLVLARTHATWRACSSTAGKAPRCAAG